MMERVFVKKLNPILLSGKEVLPLIEGGKGISITSGQSSGAWANAGGVGTFSGVNADSYDDNGNIIPQTYRGKTRRERHDELVQFSINGGITQAQIAHEVSKGEGRIHVNILWEMGAAEQILTGILEKTKGLIHGVTCGAGMPYRIADIATKYNIYYHPIVSSARAFRALWKRSYHKAKDLLGSVVYEDPWLAGGHNGLSNSEDPTQPQNPYPRVLELRKQMREFGLDDVPIVMAGGVWHLKDWADWIDNPDLGPVAFQFGTRPLLTKESPISDAWKKRLLTLKEGDVFLNKFSPTGFYSSAVNNDFIAKLRGRSERQISYATQPTAEMTETFPFGPRKRPIYISSDCKIRADQYVQAGYTEQLKTPDDTIVFVKKDEADDIVKNQIDCMGCLSQCRFSNWTQDAAHKYTTGKKADPRSFCIQKTLQDISHTDQTENQLMFSGHNAYKFAQDPFYENGHIPTMKELVDRIMTGH